MADFLRQPAELHTGTGGTYTLTETKAPAGYTKADDITFSVDINGKITVDGKTQTDGTLTMWISPTPTASSSPKPR